MSEREDADYIQAEVGLHPDVRRAYEPCTHCPMDRDCSDCEAGRRLDREMCNFLRPRMPFPNL